jgi:hypothetical protein
MGRSMNARVGIRVYVIWVLALAVCVLASCSYGPPTVTGIRVSPGNGFAHSELAPPQNQVTFEAIVLYSDGSESPNPIASGVTWSVDFPPASGSPWVSLSGNTAICTQPAPGGLDFFGQPQPPATITASATVRGTAYSAGALLFCY